MTDVLISVGLLVVGFVLLIKGADFFVEGSSSVAKMLKVPSIIIGLTIVAMGTSLPECAVSHLPIIMRWQSAMLLDLIYLTLWLSVGFVRCLTLLQWTRVRLRKNFHFL